MNRENITLVRDHLLALRDSPERFNMRFWTARVDKRGEHYETNEPSPAEVHSDCGTCACIAGWTQALLNPTVERPHDAHIVVESADILGLTDRQAFELFVPWRHARSKLHPSWHGHVVDIPPRAGALVLDHLLKTGTVDWSVIGPRRCFDENGREITPR